MLPCAALALAVLPAPWAQNTRGFEQANAAPGGVASGAYFALVIGINDYPSLPHLTTAVHDAQSVGALLEAKFGFKGHVTYLLNQDATRARIMDALEGETGYAQTLTEGDNLLIYYAGHGYYNQRTDKAYWLPWDAESALSANHISADDLTTAIRGIAAHHVLVISDSCYSGDLTRGVDDSMASSGEQSFIRRMMAAPSRNILSSGGNEPVADAGPGGHSVFAAALLHALSEQQGSLFTAADLAEPVKAMVRSHSDQIPEYMRIGNSMPRNFPIDIGDFVFARNGAAAAPAEGSSPANVPSRNAPIPVSGPATGATAPANDEDYNKARNLEAAKNYTEAAPLLKKSCSGGNGRACTDEGFLYTMGNGVGKDLAQAAALYRKGCEAGNAPGCRDLGLAYERGDGVTKDLTQAATLYSKACDRGAAGACGQAANLYAAGNGVPKDPARAASLLSKGCDANDPQACELLGMHFIYGDGVEKDPVQAVALFRKACNAGEPRGCANLAVSYERGNGVAADAAQAASFYRKACDAGNAIGCAGLGWLTENGSGVEKDMAQAASLYEKGCDGDNAVGCRDLANLLEQGKGVTQDKSRAGDLYQKACKLGDQPACDTLKRLNP